VRAAVLFTLGSRELLLNCPFLLAESSQRPCCPGEIPSNKCPLSKSFDTCPYVLSEAKIGLVQSIHATSAPAAVTHFDPANVVTDAIDERPVGCTSAYESSGFRSDHCFVPGCSESFKGRTEPPKHQCSLPKWRLLK
jgi:hypothetical protein